MKRETAMLRYVGVCAASVAAALLQPQSARAGAPSAFVDVGNDARATAKRSTEDGRVASRRKYASREKQ